MRILVLAVCVPGVAVADAPPSGSVAMGDFATCAITAKKQVACWGLGSDMEKYPADIVRSKKPQVIAGLANVERIAIGYRYACAIDKAGAVTCWGMLDPDADKKGGTKPAKIAKVSDAVEIGVGKYEACARTKKGDVWCWGQIDGHALQLEPKLLKQNTARMAVGRGALCVTGADGAVACGGGAQSGGHGTPLTEWKAMAALGSAVDMVAQTGLACAITAAGKATCEGDHAKNLQDGLGKLKTPTKALWAADDGSFACALDTAGVVRCFGESFAGQLGDGVVEKNGARGPVEPKLPEPVVDGVAGPAGMCVRTKSLKLFCWGANDGNTLLPPPAGNVVKTPTEVKLP